jgi:SNF2 family DNA or RNA helicase
VKILADRAGDRIIIAAPPTYKDLIRRIPGARYNDLSWSVPLSWAACRQLRAELGEMLEVGPGLNAWAAQFIAWKAGVLRHRVGETAFEGLPEGLRPLQVTGASWMAAVGRSLLGDDMGAGKTIQTIAALELLGDQAYPAIIVTTNSMKYVWEAEFAKWAPGRTVQVIHGTAGQRRKQFEAEADVTVINWEALRLHSRLAPYGSIALTDAEKERKELNGLGAVTVVADEAHKAVDPKAKQTRAYWFLMHEATFRYALTGTAVINRGADLFGIMHGLAPEEYPVRTSWTSRYFNAGEGRWGWEVFGLKPHMQEELFDVLDLRFLRRTKEQIAPELPETLPAQYRYVDLGTKQAKAYRDLKKEMMTAETEGGVLVASNPLVLAGRLAQVAGGLPVVEDGKVTALTTPSVKVEALLEILEESPGDPVVVFTVSRLLANLVDEQLTKKGYRTVKITGDVDAAMRAANVARFQVGEADVAIVTTAAGAEGITLTAANRIVFLQRDWSAVRNMQAEGRVDRIGQTRSVQPIYVIARDTIEERVLDVNTEKEGFMQEILRDELT